MGWNFQYSEATRTTMAFGMPDLSRRVIRQEWLDDAPPHEAEQSLRDLERINRIAGGHEVLRKSLYGLFEADAAWTLLDVGAATGDMGRVVTGQYPNARVTSVDYRHHHVAAAPPPRLVADAFALPFPARAFDIVHCSLFLHHFSDAQVITLLRSFGATARRYVVLNDLERHPLAYWFLPATRWIFRWHPLTLHDGPISVAAAFKPAELASLAIAAGLQNVTVRSYRPAFRLALIARPPVI